MGNALRDTRRGEGRYRLYVIEALQPDGRRIFYVGQTGLSPLERLRQHTKGKRYCGPCTRRSYIPGAKGTRLRLRQDLLRGRRRIVYLRRKDAERAERVVAKELRTRGYTVRGGH